MSLVLAIYLVIYISEDFPRENNNPVRRENGFSGKCPNVHLIVL